MNNVKLFSTYKNNISLDEIEKYINKSKLHFNDVITVDYLNLLRNPLGTDLGFTITVTTSLAEYNIRSSETEPYIFIECTYNTYNLIELAPDLSLKSLISDELDMIVKPKYILKEDIWRECIITKTEKYVDPEIRISRQLVDMWTSPDPKNNFTEFDKDYVLSISKAIMNKDDYLKIEHHLFKKL